MAKKKTRKKTAKKMAGIVTGGWGRGLKKKRRSKRNLALGTLGRKGSGTAKSHKPLGVLEKRLSRLSKIVAERKKNPKKWA